MHFSHWHLACNKYGFGIKAGKDESLGMIGGMFSSLLDDYSLPRPTYPNFPIPEHVGAPVPNPVGAPYRCPNSA